MKVVARYMNEFTLINNILMTESNITCTLDSRNGDIETVCARVAFRANLN